MTTTTQIKKRKQLTHVHLKDGRILCTESTPSEIYERIGNNSHIMIEGELHSKYDIVSANPARIDNLEAYILNQPKEIQDKIRRKKDWLLREQWTYMDYKYAVHYVENVLLGNRKDE